MQWEDSNFKMIIKFEMIKILYVSSSNFDTLKIDRKNKFLSLLLHLNNLQGKAPQIGVEVRGMRTLLLNSIRGTELAQVLCI